MGSGEISERLRREGNRLYKMVSAEEGSLCLFERRVRATCAEEIYMQALDESVSWEDRASCCKNLGMLNILRSKLQLQHTVSCIKNCRTFREELRLCREYLLRGISFLLQAKKHGARAGKAKDWVAHLESSIDEAVDWAIVESSSSDLSLEEALFWFTEGETGVSGSNGDLVIYQEEARDLVKAMVEEKFKAVQAYVRQVEAEKEAEEARRQRELLRSRVASVQVERVSIQFNSLNVSSTPAFYTPSSYTLLQQYFVQQF